MTARPEFGAVIAVEGSKQQIIAPWHEIMANDTTLSDKFWGRIDQSAGPDGCWPWTAKVLEGKNRIRGTFYYKGKNILAHRIVSTIAHGMPLPDLECLHSCDNPSCCNPAHLRWGTHKENMVQNVERARNVNANKTHCTRGHPYEGDNLVLRPSGRRGCATCNRERRRRERAELAQRKRTGK